jgi:hypothetical protein
MGWTVCHKHGARGGAPKGERNGNYRHGRHTKEAGAERQRLKVLRASTTDLIRLLLEEYRLKT